jgi:hypothetical protein
MRSRFFPVRSRKPNWTMYFLTDGTATAGKNIMKTIIFIFILAVTCSAFPAKLRWNANLPAENVTEYRIYKQLNGAPALIATVPATDDPKQSTPIDVQGGEVLTVTAFNGFESEPSDPVTVPVKPSKPGEVEVVEIEVSANMTDWEPVALVPLKTDDPARFIRTRIVTIQK